MHFLLHGIHHYLPMDKLRLVMPPTLFLALATPFWKLAHTVFFWNWHVATAVFSGGIFGYICYDLTHYFLHHKNLPSYWRQLKKYHLQHHFMDYENGFGVTSRFWDVVFGTELAPPPKIVKTAWGGCTWVGILGRRTLQQLGTSFSGLAGVVRSSGPFRQTSALAGIA